MATVDEGGLGRAERIERPTADDSGRAAVLRLPRRVRAGRLVAIDAPGMGTDACSLAVGLQPGLPDADLIAAERAELRVVHGMDHTRRSPAGPDGETIGR